MTAFLKLSQLKEAGHFGAWLRQIVTRSCFGELAKNQKNIDVTNLLLKADKFFCDEINKGYDKIFI